MSAFFKIYVKKYTSPYSLPKNLKDNVLKLKKLVFFLIFVKFFKKNTFSSKKK